jgi:predicted nucleic acid-binding protein
VIVLDTNVLSEVARPKPNPAVLEWVDAQDSSTLVITALTAAEVRAGVAILPDGHRKREVGLRMESLLAETFAGFILAFDVGSSDHYADIVAGRRRAGRPISAFDAQIAAVCRQHEASLATRNTADFTDTGIQLINPWDRRA